MIFAVAPASDRSHGLPRVFARGQAFPVRGVRGEGNAGDALQPSAPGLAPRFRPPDNSLIRSEIACYFPVLAVGNSLFRARSSPQPDGCNASNAMILQCFLDESGDCGARKFPASR